MRPFDFVIVGAGTAGCVLASEICRKKLGRVLLIETGSASTMRHLKVPSEYPLAFHGQNAWPYWTKPQEQLAGRRIPLPAGKTLGGSSAINAMIYLRGHPTDFDLWEEKLGSDWNRGNVAEAFEAMETAIGLRDFVGPELHPAIAAFLKHSGYATPKSPTLLEPRIGLGPYMRCQSNGRRRSAWDLWLKPICSNRNDDESIEVLTGASVQQLVINTGRVVGVSLSQGAGGQNTSFVSAQKGVIVCAGAIQSPRLLLASGIGDSDELKEINVPCLLGSPMVGKHFQDHLVFPVVRELIGVHGLAYPASDGERRDYAVLRTGPRSSNIAEVGGFFRLPKGIAMDSNFHVPADKIEFDFQWHVTPTHYLEYPHRKTQTNAISVAVSLSRPASRGSVRLIRAPRSDSLEEFQMEIDPAYLSARSDLIGLVEAVRWTRSVLECESYTELLGCELLPGAKRQSDEQVMATIARFATTLYHYAGTCGMSGDSSGVIDSRFQVRGLDGLWVCDASSMPSLVSCNTQATVMMMAYRLADWLT